MSNKTANPTHPTKSSAARPNHLAIDDRSLPLQPDFNESSGESSLPKSDPPNPIVIL